MESNKKMSLPLLLAGLVLWETGCLKIPKGVIYEHTVSPYILPSGSNRQIAERSCRVRFFQIKDPVYTKLSILYGMDRVRDEMVKNNIAEVRYADEEILSFFFGAFERRWLIFYGNLKRDE